LQRLLSCSPAIIYSCRPGGKYGFTFISKNLTSFLGYEPREIMESPDFWLHHVHPQDRLRLMAALPSLEHQGSLSVEYRFRAKNGTWRWLEDDGKLVRDAQGTPLEVIGSWIDVTARKEAEKVIREAREYAESIIETLHEPLMVLDADLRVISANRAFYQTFQENPAETEGRFLYELGQRQWGIPKLRELLEEIIPNNSHLQDFEVQHYFPHLGRKEMLLNARRILREGEGTQLILLAIEDVTQHKQTEENLRRSLENLQRALGETTAALASAAEKRDPYTAGHQQRVAQLAGAIAREMGCTEDQMEAIRVAGILHDIGKLYVPSEILSKPTRLSDLEFAMIKTHSQVGFDILKEIKFPWPVAQIVLQHHERMNGSGYPHGLTSPDILPEARILAVADVVEAMASHRPYRPALGIQQALQEISRHRGILYDPQAVDACLRLFTERNFQFN
jgi:putative nucleotidyltransferase with HDIG domain/PAS domain S-box-containing protein